jgi:hypothetical protein
MQRRSDLGSCRRLAARWQKEIDMALDPICRQKITRKRLGPAIGKTVGFATWLALSFCPLSACAASPTSELAAPAILSIVDFGARDTPMFDSHDAIQTAFDQAKKRHRPVSIPPGHFSYSGVLVADGITVSGTPETSVLQALDGANEAIVLTGKGARLQDLTLIGTGESRLATFESGVVWVREADDAAVDHLTIQGSSSVGIVIDGSEHVLISTNSIAATRADSIHLTNGSHDVRVEKNRVTNAGDDGISVVSYREQPVVTDIVIDSNTVLANAWGRAISVVGGAHVTITNNTITGGAADRAGIYLAAEQEWKTSAVSDVLVRGNSIVDAGGRSSGHGAVTIYNSYSNETANERILIESNNIRNSRAAPIAITGPGTQRITVRGNQIGGPTHGPIVANAGPRSLVTEDKNFQN